METSIAGKYRFEISRTPLSAEEQGRLDSGLAALGVDDTYWHLLNGILETGSSNVIPKLVRAYEGRELVGVFGFQECRRISYVLFPNLLGRMMDIVPLPTFNWWRTDLGVDLLSSREVVLPKVDRGSFVAQALAFLNQRHLFGVLLEEQTAAAPPAALSVPVYDWGFCETDFSADELLAEKKNLRKKVNKFRNKGGTIEVFTGRVDAELREGMLSCAQQAADHGRILVAPQEGYPSFVKWAAEAADERIVHIVARLDGELVGYHSFAHLGPRLVCLSGGFDRSGNSTYHAYENILIEAMRWAEVHGVETISFGAAGNRSKASLMQRFVKCEVRMLARFGVLRRVLRFLVGRAAIGRGAVDSVRDWESKLQRPGPPHRADSARSGQLSPQLRGEAGSLRAAVAR